MTTYQFAECTADQYNNICSSVAAALDTPISFLQAPFYGKLQEKSGKEVVYCSITKDSSTIGCGLGVIYTAASFRFLYFPYGPICKTWDSDLVADFQPFLRQIARQYNCAFARLDADELHGTTNTRAIPAKLARTASLQPRAEWVLDISSPEDNLWLGFHKHARYNIRLAERAEVQIAIYPPSQAPIEIFYQLMQATGQRDSFGILSKSYYEAYLQTLSDDEGFVIIASINAKPAATGLFVLYDKQAHYVFAGSSNDFRKIAPAYTVIWSAIKEAKNRGCNLFNFGGVIDDVKGHDLGGVTGFKKRFGGYCIAHKNPVDFVYRRCYYAAFKLYKTFR